jgi:Flp pilus assembly protein TadD
MKAYPMPRHWRCSPFAWSLIILFFLWGCVPLPSIKPEDISLDGFPPLKVGDGMLIDPLSDPDPIADVNILALNERARKILDERIIHIRSPKKRLEALLDLMHTNGILSESDDKHLTKTASETLESGTGNCLSFSSAFVAMARYANLDARFQDIPTYPNWDRHGDLLFFNRHVSAIVDINLNTKFEIDFHNRGNLPYRKEDQPDQSIRDQRVFSQYYNNLGSLHFASGNMGDAFRYFVKAIEEDPGLSYVWSNLGSVYARNNQEDAAERAYQRALAINNYEYTAMSNLVRLYTGQGRTEEADIYRQRVRWFRNKNPYYHYAVSEKTYDEGQYTQTVKHLKDAIYRKEDEHQFHFALARAYLKLGKNRKAEKSIEKARSYSPDEATQQYYGRMWKALSDESYRNN